MAGRKEDREQMEKSLELIKEHFAQLIYDPDEKSKRFLHAEVVSFLEMTFKEIQALRRAIRILFDHFP